MTNHLATAQSLYLRKHAENPIDWWYWCEEAIALAKEGNKPIFLSIGYSSCHWCTVMEGEAFSDVEVADYLNAHFVAIKVDREERPDLDSIYMQTLQMMTGEGGWPLNVFLDPQTLLPFYGGTYFPLTPRYGRAGFLQVLQSIARYYHQEGNEAQSIQQEILGYLQQTTGNAAQAGVDLSSRELLQTALDNCTGTLTVEGEGNRFPMMPHAFIALRGSRWTTETRYPRNDISQQWGINLVLGGIYDHVAGGFHRYTVDSTWTVPHFEKMLYDNGQILEYLAGLWGMGYREPAIARSVAGTVEWLQREMSAPGGYFYAAQDADSLVAVGDEIPKEGAFYVWTYRELAEILTTEELNAIEVEFTVTRSGNFEGANVLQRRRGGELSPPSQTALEKLRDCRYGNLFIGLKSFDAAEVSSKLSGRIPPVTDTKMIVAWNSLTISGLAHAYGVFKQPLYLQLAIAAAQFIDRHQRINGQFYRLNYDGQAVGVGQSEDYALFIKALLDLYQVTGTSEWLTTAVSLQGEFDALLWSNELGGYYNGIDRSNDLIVRERSYQDHATPTGNGIAMSNLIRLSLLTGELSYFDRAERGLQAFSGMIARLPQACPSLIAALDWYQNLTKITTTDREHRLLIEHYLPTVTIAIDPNLPPSHVGEVCQGSTCLTPATTTEELWTQIQTSVLTHSSSFS
jgi:uncharacterized protein